MKKKEVITEEEKSYSEEISSVLKEFREKLDNEYVFYYKLDTEYNLDFENKTYNIGINECCFQDIINYILFNKNFDHNFRMSYSYDLAFASNIEKLLSVKSKLDNDIKKYNINFNFWFISKKDLLNNEISFYGDDFILYANNIKDEIFSKAIENNNIEKTVYDYYLDFLNIF